MKKIAAVLGVMMVSVVVGQSVNFLAFGGEAPIVGALVSGITSFFGTQLVLSK